MLGAAGGSAVLGLAGIRVDGGGAAGGGPAGGSRGAYPISPTRRAAGTAVFLLMAVPGFISSHHYRGHGPAPGRPGELDGTHGRAPAGSAGVSRP